MRTRPRTRAANGCFSWTRKRLRRGSKQWPRRYKQTKRVTFRPRRLCRRERRSMGGSDGASASEKRNVPARPRRRLYFQPTPDLAPTKLTDRRHLPSLRPATFQAKRRKGDLPQDGSSFPSRRCLVQNPKIDRMFVENFFSFLLPLLRTPHRQTNATTISPQLRRPAGEPPQRACASRSRSPAPQPGGARPTFTAEA